MDDRQRWNERYRTDQGPREINPRLRRYLPLLKRGRALDLAAGLGQNAALLDGWQVVLLDISEEALQRAQGARVQADAAALPFRPASFDTVINTRFFDPRVDFAYWLAPGGTVFFETFTAEDAKYRPDFSPAHRFTPALAPLLFAGLEILVSEPTDDGRRAFITIIARRPE